MHVSIDLGGLTRSTAWIPSGVSDSTVKKQCSTEFDDSLVVTAGIHNNKTLESRVNI